MIRCAALLLLMLRLNLILCGVLLFGRAQADSSAVPDGLTKQGEAYLLDLATVLRLANARNLDIQIARERLSEARAVHQGALAQFFPWLAPGVSYRRHDDLIQDTSGNLFDVHKQSYAPGATLAAQLDVGDAIYKSLTSRQQVNVALHATEAQRQTSAFTAARDYFDLLFAQVAVTVAREAVAISTNYEGQLVEAVRAGVAFKGDELRVRVERENNELTLRRVLEQQRVAAAQLAQTLHLAPAIELQAHDRELVPLQLLGTNTALSTLVAQALGSRPEARQAQAAIAAARETSKGASYGPLIPSAGAQFFAGGLGGSSDAGPSRFSNQEELFAGLSWKIGPGGLFDFTRTRAAEAQLKTAELSADKTKDEIARQVVEAATRVQSLTDQIEMARSALEAAQEGLRLAQLRREFAVGVVLENIQAERDLTRARLDYLQAIAELNKAQYTMLRALGRM
ncbi:MAG TPA: TolC family protein [Candidatus Binatia bacterium]|nr:TolC family protein [Candidatus Binatia bacterium]